ncbi:hypothetical protein [Dehalobacter sp. TeCB1]|uniref:hypothetical protein n=1 Tax=Dehalobacter sp. TeCB1 TaxID=1843715 RepID=UPI00083B14CD|nr:hypothetical protein [Dehalobacter sp. TeCB1]OCZ54320.1 hypothetical protein A7D23_06005 [Dehalobacter sp. TeCB1]
MLPRNSVKKKKEYRIHERLSNGQFMNLYFSKHCHSSGIHIWNVGLYISSNTREANNFWLGKKVPAKITGRCGIEGLKKAFDFIMEFAQSLGIKDELHVGWEDDRRKYAYRYLLKRGFLVDEDQGFYHIRNMQYREPGESSVNTLRSGVYHAVS